jgi:2-phosphosulfolactate phosphatase
MQFQYITLETCGDASGVVVVIDVLRAFTTAAYALAAGAGQIALVSSIEDAFALKARYPAARLMGEEKGLPIAGFDYGNSPSAIVTGNLNGCTMIQRTSAGTQGVVRSLKAEVLLAGSLCCAAATAKYIQGLAPEWVTFVITGSHTADQGDEDRACADYLQGLLEGNPPDRGVIVQRVRESAAARKFMDPKEGEFPLSDLEYALAIDWFDFVLRVEREGDGLWMRAVE